MKGATRRLDHAGGHGIGGNEDGKGLRGQRSQFAHQLRPSGIMIMKSMMGKLHGRQQDQERRARRDERGKKETRNSRVKAGAAAETSFSIAGARRMS